MENKKIYDYMYKGAKAMWLEFTNRLNNHKDRLIGENHPTTIFIDTDKVVREIEPLERIPEGIKNESGLLSRCCGAKMTKPTECLYEDCGHEKPHYHCEKCGKYCGDAILVPEETRPTGNDMGEVSDGYHTFNELYEHRHLLFAQIAQWKSKKHSDGTMFDGWFIAGINTEKGKQITYHIPMRLWDSFQCGELANAPEWDGHTPNDVLSRLKKLKKIEVEPLQNGERDWKQMKKEIEELRDKNPDEVQDSRYGFRMRIGDIITTHADFNTLISDFEDLLSQSKKEDDIASDFLYWHPIGGGFPDQSIKIGVAFEPCSGCYEDFGFIIEKDGKRISAGISLKDAISKARMELESLTNQKKDI